MFDYLILHDFLSKFGDKLCIGYAGFRLIENHIPVELIP